MKRIILLLTVVFLGSSALFSQDPPPQATGITINSSTSFGSDISWTNGVGDNRLVFIKKVVVDDENPTPTVTNTLTYTASSVYGSVNTDNSGTWYCIYNGPGSSVSVSSLTANTEYRLQIFEYAVVEGSQVYNTATATGNPLTFSTGAPLAPPTVPITNFAANSDDFQNVSFSWGGTGSFVMFLRKIAAGDATPDSDPLAVNGEEYTPGSSFGDGEVIVDAGANDEDWYCVYSYSGNTTTVQGLGPNTDYKAVLYSFVGNGGARVYNTYSATAENELNFTTSDFEAPTVQHGFGNILPYVDHFDKYQFTANDEMDIIVFMTTGAAGTFVPPDLFEEEYPVVDNVYQNSTAVTDENSHLWYPVYTGLAEGFYVSGISHSTAYQFAVYSYNSHGSVYKYNRTINAGANIKTITSGKPAPASQASVDVPSGTIDKHSASVSLTPSDPVAGAGRVVFIKKGNSGDPPIANNNTYFNNNNEFEEGSELDGGWFCVYNGGVSFTVSNLDSYTEYQLAVYEYNNFNSAILYNTASTGTATFTTLSDDAPATPATDLLLTPLATKMKMQFDAGVGYNVMVLIKEIVTVPDEIDVVPDLSGTYTANADFSSATVIIDGWKAVYNGTHTDAAENLEITNLVQDSEYRVAIVTYNGNTTGPAYNVTGIPYANGKTFDKVLVGYSSADADWDPVTKPSDPLDNIAVAAGSSIDDALHINELTFIPYGYSSSVSMDETGRLTVDGTFTQNGFPFYIDEKSMVFTATDNIPVIIRYDFDTRTNEWLTFANPLSNSYYELYGNNFYIKTFDETIPDWEYQQTIKNSDGMIIYSYDNFAFHLTGNVAPATNKVKTVTYTTGDSYTGYNLVGNPYMAALDWEAANDATHWTRTNIGSTFWIWNTGSGNYGSYNRDTDAGTLSVNQYIGPMQAFWVKAIAPNPALTIRPDVSSQSAAGFKKTLSDSELPLMRITAKAENGYRDEAVLGFHEEAANGIDNFDSDKLDGSFKAPQLFTYNNENRLSINMLPDELLDENMFTVPVGFTIGVRSGIELNISVENLPTDFTIVFSDKYRGENFELDEGRNEFSFEANMNEPINRFEIVFVKTESATSVEEDLSDAVSIYSFNDNIFILSMQAQKSDRVMVYDMTGKVQFMKVGLESGLNTLKPNLKAGLYVVLVQSGNTVRSEKVYVK